MEKQTINVSIDSSNQKVTSKVQSNENASSDVISEPLNENSLKQALKTDVVSKELGLEKKNAEKTINDKKLKTNAPRKNNLENKTSDEGYRVKTTYYYYNGENNKQIATTDKNIIDSLLINTESQQDALSAHEKRILKIVKKNR